MDKRENTISQIYLLSLDTFMIMTVMGITLGIIFFILNPTLNSGVTVYVPELEFKLDNRKYKQAKTVLLRKYGCNIEQDEFCSIKLENNNKIEIILLSRVSNTALLVISLFNKEKELIDKKSIIEQAIQEIGLSFILRD